MQHCETKVVTKKKESINVMLTKPKALFSKISEEHMRSTFQNYRLENKLLQELGFNHEVLINQKSVHLLN